MKKTVCVTIVLAVTVGPAGIALARGGNGGLHSDGRDGVARIEACKAKIAGVGGVIEAYEARHGEFPESRPPDIPPAQPCTAEAITAATAFVLATELSVTLRLTFDALACSDRACQIKQNIVNIN